VLIFVHIIVSMLLRELCFGFMYLSLMCGRHRFSTFEMEGKGIESSKGKAIIIGL